jgi:hypothetical protein
VVNCSYFYEKIKDGKKIKEEAFPIFDGASFKEKNQQLSDLLEDESEEDDQILSKKKFLVRDSLTLIQRVVSLWYNGHAKDQETTEEALEQFFGKDEEGAEEQASKDEDSKADKSS